MVLQAAHDGIVAKAILYAIVPEIVGLCGQVKRDQDQYKKAI
jgi:hypothetical protein